MIDENNDPVIIDFGLSKDSSDPCMVLRQFVGSKMYMAPEIVDCDQHSFPCDMWSVGIMLYNMLSGSYPFNFRNLDKEIVSTPVLFLGPKWSEISHEAKHLISKLLEKDQYNRINAKQALDHPWFKKYPPKKHTSEAENKA